MFKLRFYLLAIAALMITSVQAMEPTDSIAECPDEYEELIHLVLENDGSEYDYDNPIEAAVKLSAAGKIDYDRLIKAVAQVESGGNPKAVSPKGNYVGYLQLSKVAVDGCNKIIGEKKYSYKDRYDKDKSIEMFYIIQQKYNPNNDIILALRIWKEGISALKKKRQVTPYVKKVLGIYDKLRKEPTD